MRTRCCRRAGSTSTGCWRASAPSWSTPGRPRSGAGGDALHRGRARAGPRLDGRELHLRQPPVHRGPCAPPGARAARRGGHRPLRRPGPDGEPGGGARHRRAHPASRRRQCRRDPVGRPRRRGHRRAARVPGLAAGARLSAPAEERLPSASPMPAGQLRLPGGARRRQDGVGRRRPGRPRSCSCSRRRAGGGSSRWAATAPSTARPPTWRATPPSPRRSPRPMCGRDRGPSRSTRSPPTPSPSACAAATSVSAGSPRGCWCAATRSAPSTRPTDRA